MKFNDQILLYIIKIYFSYPSTFIHKEFQKFSSEYLCPSSFLPYIDNEKQYFLLYHKLMNQSTIIKAKTDTKTNKENRLIVHYKHEKRFEPFKRDMHRIFETIFKKSDGIDPKLIVGSCNRRSLAHELIRKRPTKRILQDKPLKSKLFSKYSI
jgi:hypothetical protein